MIKKIRKPLDEKAKYAALLTVIFHRFLIAFHVILSQLNYKFMQSYLNERY